MQYNIIKCIDSFAGMSTLSDESVDLIFVDPPYWMRVSGELQRVGGSVFKGCDDSWDNQFTSLEDYEKFTEKWLTNCKRIMKPNASIWAIGSMQCIYTIGAVMQRLGFWIINDVVWHKTNPTPNFKGTRLNSSHETLIWATKSSNSKYTFNYKTAKELNTDNVDEFFHSLGERKQLGSVWKIPVCQGKERLRTDDGSKLHNTQKPEELLRRIIAINTKIDDIVFDPFGGTFTTAAVAKSMSRKYISFDNVPEYCDYGRRRVDSIEIHITDIEKASFDIKPLKVTLSEMIDLDYLVEGEKLYIKNGAPKAVLQHNGRVIINGVEYDIHNGASVALSKTNKINGYDHWYVMRNKRLVKIADVREDFRSNIKGTDNDTTKRDIDKLCEQNNHR